MVVKVISELKSIYRLMIFEKLSAVLVKTTSELRPPCPLNSRDPPHVFTCSECHHPLFDPSCGGVFCFPFPWLPVPVCTPPARLPVPPTRGGTRSTCPLSPPSHASHAAAPPGGQNSNKQSLANNAKHKLPQVLKKISRRKY